MNYSRAFVSIHLIVAVEPVTRDKLAPLPYCAFKLGNRHYFCLIALRAIITHFQVLNSNFSSVVVTIVDYEGDI
jgi:hypothetical protein